jgi:phage/plasmid-associated DNA primase
VARHARTANVSHLSLNEISRNFQIQTLRDRRLNLTNEIDHIDKLQEGKFKELIAGDEMTVDIKFKNAVTFKPNCLFAIATNSVPSFADRSEGLWRRFCILPSSNPSTKIRETSISPIDSLRSCPEFSTGHWRGLVGCS